MSVKRRVCRVVFTCNNHNSSVWKWYVVWICFEIWVLFSTLCSAASHQNLNSKKPLLCFCVSDFLFKRDYVFCRTALSQSSRILFLLFSVLEKHGTAPWTHTGVKWGATAAHLDGATCLCTAVRALSPLHFMIAERDEAGWERRGSPFVQYNLFSASRSLTSWQKVLIILYVVLRRLRSKVCAFLSLTK